MNYIFETMKQLVSVCASFCGLALQLWLMGLVIKKIMASGEKKDQGPDNTE